ncbi:titin-like [Nymphalis io]|uniref:titin-like n=1 Tax=Inachis io TaxID=171585 RepID=UPI0021672FE8|nr:titin-like [Nymphalis io]
MWLQTLLITLPAFSIAAIKVPVETTAETITSTVPINGEQVVPIYYVSDEANIDSYLLPPDPHKPEEVDHQKVATPATYLLPPAPDAQNEYYYKPTEPGEQTDWLPIIAAPQKQAEVIPIAQEGRPNLQELRENLRTRKMLNGEHGYSIPSRNLLPPRENAPNDFVLLSPSVELELPSEEIDHTLHNSPAKIPLSTLRGPLKYLMNVPIKLDPIPLPYITPPKNEYRSPTRLYPKKYYNEFKPVPIPVSQYADASVEEVPNENPAEPLKQTINTDNEYFVPSDQKKKYLYEQSDKKRKLKQHHEVAELDTTTSETLTEVPPAEPEASETNYRSPGRGEYPTELKQSHHANPKAKNGLKSKGERTEFRMHGMKGPHSYQFGYDTGKGKNRQFRYEERDNDGHVKGHYGYMDKFGKLRVVNYDADPEHGFRAEVPVEKE